MKRVIAMLVALTLSFVSIGAFAHGGGTDKNGCHTNRRTGSYHCHSDSDGGRPPTTGEIVLIGIATLIALGLITLPFWLPQSNTLRPEPEEPEEEAAEDDNMEWGVAPTLEGGGNLLFLWRW